MPRHPPVIRRLNDRLLSDLGENPRYAWRWSEDLLHVMEIVDPETGQVQLREACINGIYAMTPVTVVRKLLPFHPNCWVMCALVEVNKRDGSFAGTGNHAWIPLSSSRSGPVCLPSGEIPDISVTESLIASVRAERSRSPIEAGLEWEEQQARKEKARWNRCYDEIRDASTAFHNVPGKKAHVSFSGLIH